MTPNIDIKRLRRLCADRDALSLGLGSFRERLQDATRDVQRLERDLDNTRAHYGNLDPDDKKYVYLKRAEKALADARQVKAALSHDREVLGDKLGLVSGLARKGIVYAESLGVCPSDLSEGI